MLRQKLAPGRINLRSSIVLIRHIRFLVNKFDLPIALNGCLSMIMCRGTWIIASLVRRHSSMSIAHIAQVLGTYSLRKSNQRWNPRASNSERLVPSALMGRFRERKVILRMLAMFGRKSCLNTVSIHCQPVSNRSKARRSRMKLTGSE